MEHVEVSGQVAQSEWMRRRRYSRLTPSCIYSFTTGVSLWAHAVTAGCTTVTAGPRPRGGPRNKVRSLWLTWELVWRHLRGDRWRTTEAKSSCWPQTTQITDDVAERRTRHTSYEMLRKFNRVAGRSRETKTTI